MTTADYSNYGIHSTLSADRTAPVAVLGTIFLARRRSPTRECRQRFASANSESASPQRRTTQSASIGSCANMHVYQRNVIKSMHSATHRFVSRLMFSMLMFAHRFSTQEWYPPLYSICVLRRCWDDSANCVCNGMTGSPRGAVTLPPC